MLTFLFTGVDETDNSKTINEFYQWENEGFIPPVTKPQEEFLNHGKHTLQTVSNTNADPRAFEMPIIRTGKLIGLLFTFANFNDEEALLSIVVKTKMSN